MKVQDRRQFIDTLVRGGIISLLALVSGDLIRRWNEADECKKQYSCGNCDLSKRCQLPPADAYRLDRAKMLNRQAEDGRNRK